MLPLILAAAVFLATAGRSCSRLPEEPSVRDSGSAGSAAGNSREKDANSLKFEEMTRSGVDFVYRNGEESGNLTILETIGGGVAIFDYDRDGMPDLFFPGGGRIVSNRAGFEIKGLPGRLFRNRGAWRFDDVTRSAGLVDDTRYTHGATAADFDNDGFPDLLVTSFQGLVLYRNEGGLFRDVTLAAGLAEPGWTTSAAWLDYDGDGHPDIYAVRYVDWTPQNQPDCNYHVSGKTDVCSPSVFGPLDDRLYRNRGDGTFEEVGRKAGLVPGGKGLGVVAADLDGDRHIDLYVANDTTPNFLYRNRGDGTFEEIGQLACVALSGEGVPTGSMGVASGDIDCDGDLDLWVTNYEGELNEFYRNDGSMRFVPIGLAWGLSAISRPLVGWGTGLVDFDGDTIPEVFVANGHLMHHLPGTPREQPALLFRRSPEAARFESVGQSSGAWFTKNRQARGCAFADLDNDGDPDAVIVQQNAPASLLRNDQASRNRFLRIRLEGKRCNRSAIGTLVVVTCGDRRRIAPVVGGGSYLSGEQAVLRIGLGPATSADQVEIRWPDGTVDLHQWLSAGPVWLLRQSETAASPQPQ